MKLRLVKLSGFKSFVDPTRIQLPAQLTGIVGPNGCGKSNVMDALRWVLGESSARQLRGESMTDVIFNGAQGRSPVGKAAVELHFDNSDGRAAGAFAGVAEIVVRRELGRDGVSHYRINHSACRRRDVADLFFGTGLGPRSYSLIEQGMISRVAEAAPDALRAFLEEAGGISRYKERRRETELRMTHTRDNLTQVAQLCQELQGQVKRLERQSEAAKKFRAHKAEQRHWQQTRLQARLQAVDAEIITASQQLQTMQTAIQARLADLRTLEAAIEQDRAGLTEAQAKADLAQAQYYQHAAERTGVEQQIQQAARDLQALLDAQAQLTTQTQQDAQTQQDLQQTLQAGETELDMLREQHTQSVEQARFADAELAPLAQQLTDAVQALQALEQRLGQAQREAQVQQARLEQLQSRREELQKREARLQAEAQALQSGQQGHAALQTQQTTLAEAVDALQQQIQDGQGTYAQLRQTLAAAEQDQDQARVRYEKVYAEQQALQQSLRVDTASTVFTATDTAGLAPLLEGLQVTTDWQAAVEMVLGWRLAAQVSDDLTALCPREWPVDRPPGRIALLAHAHTDAPADWPQDALLWQVQWQGAGAHPLQDWLHGLRACEHVEMALARRTELRPGECWITPQGALVGRHSFVWDHGPDQSDLLRRRERLRRLDDEVAQAHNALEAARSLREQYRQQLQAQEQVVETARQRLQQQQQQLTQVQAELARLLADQLARQRRASQIDEETNEIRQQLAHLAQAVQTSTQTLALANQNSDSAAAALSPLREDQTKQQTRLALLREQQARLRESAHRLELQVQALEARLRHQRERRAELDQRLAQATQRQQQLAQQLAQQQAAQPSLAAQLQHSLATQEQLETALRALREGQSAIEAALRARDSQRVQTSQQLQQQQRDMQAVEVQLGALEAKREGWLEQLQAVLPHSEADPQHYPALSADAVESRLVDLERRIEALGNVNLAAIDELAQVQERKGYLDTQHQDLSEALATLEAAIRRMDRETRERFQETFNAVNQHFQALFPRLFGGGQATLVLVGDDLLETGVSINARPPGKRNSSIHLLSGGEKALTAVALVFAIFQINPAPICVLDEVDAPLDDANVSRFCELVREMSTQTQFLFITHNKITMQLADHLIGVTMAEPGVSRIVSVDVEDALRMVG